MAGDWNNSGAAGLIGSNEFVTTRASLQGPELRFRFPRGGLRLSAMG